MRYAVIESGAVINIVMWDGVSPYSPGAGMTLVEIPAGSAADIGWTYDGTNFIAPAS